MPARLIFLFLLIACGGANAQRADQPSSELSQLLGDDSQSGFARALAARQFSFPADHGPHPEYRNEWWYLTGNLDGDNRRFGFELTFFRFALEPAVAESGSRWRSNEVYVAHFALTDVGGEQFHVSQRFSRGALDLAGARTQPFRVWLDNWQIAAVDDSDSVWHLRANDTDFGVDLSLSPLREPVLNGDGGLSQKSAATGNASYYYSVTRLQTQGRLRLGSEEHDVSGLSWLDREWSTSALAPDQLGWDWFALQLDDGTDLMFYQLRNRNGGPDSASAGTIVNAAGSSRHLRAQDVEIEVHSTWQSPRGGSYPSRWTLTVPDSGLKLDIVPVISDQELMTTVRYWEGAVNVSGDRNGRPVTGRGYVELTGYIEPVRFRNTP